MQGHNNEEPLRLQDQQHRPALGESHQLSKRVRGRLRSPAGLQ
jgi:hypothetical protein